jgi:hypothetical protein
MNLNTSALKMGGGGPALPSSDSPCSEVVEIGLLLPAQRAQALLDLSRRRRRSVGQILRDLIDRALDEE